MNDNFKLFDELDSQFKEYLNHTREIYESNINDNKWRYKFNHEVDTRPIYPDESFQEHWTNTVENIKVLIQKLSHERVKEICEVYSESVDVFSDMVTPENIGTTLNHLREFYGDLERSFMRN